MDKDLIIKEVARIIRKYLANNYKILFFGSWVKGNALPTSDIDIAILGTESVPWDLMAKILNEVDEIPTLRKIDVLDLNDKEEKFKNNVLSYAKLV